MELGYMTVLYAHKVVIVLLTWLEHLSFWMQLVN